MIFFPLVEERWHLYILLTNAFGCFETGSHVVQAESHTTELKLTLNY